MRSGDKLISLADLPAWRLALRSAGKKLVVTNGCFDILHPGHTTYLEGARELGDVLLVGVTGDDSVRQLKGADRPLNNETDRATMLAALGAVDRVCIFPDLTAMRFLSFAQPDVYVKGGDNTLETINQEERRYVEGLGGQVRIVPGVPGKSTSKLVEKIKRL
ncbi:MAG TPA: adenylyltransferase/cytidyltransferase family protein [Verrucomicrobiae bacterium]|nr:adenylyltransferase/cytidyltransferase family protein [Verrucomicrobiae bacterium]